MSGLNDIIREVRKDYENSPVCQPGTPVDDIFFNMERRIINLEKLVLFFLDKEGPKKNEQTKTDS